MPTAPCFCPSTGAGPGENSSLGGEDLRHPIESPVLGVPALTGGPCARRRGGRARLSWTAGQPPMRCAKRGGRPSLASRALAWWSGCPTAFGCVLVALAPQGSGGWDLADRAGWGHAGRDFGRAVFCRFAVQ